MFCKNCGKEVGENQKYCANCGASIGGDVSFDGKTDQAPSTSSSVIKMSSLTASKISKAGLLMAAIGFFMPVVMGMNIFSITSNLSQLASWAGTDASPFIFLVYLVFIASVAGGILLVLLLCGKSINIVLEWAVVLVAIVSFIIVLILLNSVLEQLMRNASGGYFGARNVRGGISDYLQSGFYIILIGLIVALIFQIVTAVMAAGTSGDKDFGGWLLFFYWGSIIGGILLVIELLLGLLGTITAASAAEILGYSGYTTYIISALVSLASSAVAMVFYIRAAIQMKARNSRFFDTYVIAAVISFGGSIISSLFTGIGSFIGSIIGGAIGFAISISLVIMYFQKSVRVKVYFSGRPLHDSKYWDKIERLPRFIISGKNSD